MTRDQMMEVLFAELLRNGAAIGPARRRLWTMSPRQLERELLLRGLMQYDEPPELDDDEEEPSSLLPAALGWSCSPVYLD